MTQGFKATVACGWPKVARTFRLKEGEIYMFSFKNESNLPRSMRDPYGAWLRLTMTKLEE